MASNFPIKTLMKPGWTLVIQRQRMIRGVGIDQLAMNTGLSIATVSRLLSKEQGSYESVTAVCQELGLDPEELLQSQDELARIDVSEQRARQHGG